jgi:archaetidylinositol phosphate synthase
MHRVARPCVKPLVGSRVTPNHLTTARLAFGLVAAAFFTIGTTHWNITGAGLFVIAMLLDRADGELARLGDSHSQFGHVYDLAADGICNAAVFVCIGVGVAQGDGIFAPLALPLGIMAGLATAFVEILVIRMDATGAKPTEELGGHWGFDPDDAMLVVPVAMALGSGGPLLIAAAIGAPAMLGYFVWKAISED